MLLPEYTLTMGALDLFTGTVNLSFPEKNFLSIIPVPSREPTG